MSRHNILGLRHHCRVHPVFFQQPDVFTEPHTSGQAEKTNTTDSNNFISISNRLCPREHGKRDLEVAILTQDHGEVTPAHTHTHEQKHNSTISDTQKRAS